MICPPPSDHTFSSQIRKGFARHRQEWTRHYSHLFETLQQRGLTARLDAVARATRPPAKEILTCLAATTGVLAEWALKLHTQERWSVAKYAIFLIDDFAVAILTRLERDPIWTCAIQDLAQHGAKVRGSRSTLCRNLRDSGGRRPLKAQVFGGLLAWVQRMHTRMTAELLIRRVVVAKLPAELVDLVRESMEDAVDEAEVVDVRWETYAKEESRVLARAGVARLEVSKQSTIRA